ncbi:MAG: hypothetical protein HY699_14655 [Deltaproteobacteria bacterium]|nr:hypothetical protein [Deltaproteobacteria bacterium]
MRRVAGSAEYLSDLSYDVFGRPEQISHGNNVADARSYGGAAENFRLTQILSADRNAGGCTDSDQHPDADANADAERDANVQLN